MIINFTLNDEKYEINTNGENRLIDILRENKNIKTIKPSCYLGRCGNCSVLIDGKIVNSCSILMFAVKDRNVVTGEGFINSDEYKIITKAFKEADFQPCDFCKWGKIFSIYEFYNQEISATDKNIINWLKGNVCNCSDYTSMIKAVKLSIEKLDKKKKGNDARD